jgi:uncharacterized metal-binding protein YceD (DUF177 family)
MTEPLKWSIAAGEIAGTGLKEERRATPEERKAVAAALDILSCEDLTASYEIKPLPGGRFRLDGEVEARVTQACVVTLEPVPAVVRERFSVEFRPDGEPAEAAAEGEREVFAADDIETIRDGRIDSGRIVLEYLSAALDPYPRTPGAEFEWRDPVAERSASGPFAALAKLKRPEQT